MNTDHESQIGITSAYQQALKSYREGGIPVGCALMVDGAVVSLGHNQRFQKNSNVLHGEMDCIEKAGHHADFGRSTLYTTLSPCLMCANTILLFQIPRVVILDDENTTDFVTSETRLEQAGVAVRIVRHQPSMDLNASFQSSPETRAKWLGDVGR